MEGDLERLLRAGERESGREVGERQAMADEARRPQPARAQEFPDRRLFAESAGVGAHQALLVLEEVVEREVGAFAVTAVSEEHRGSARAQGVERGAGERTAADAVEDGVGSPPVKTRLARRVEHLGTGLGSGIGSELERQRAPVGAQIHDDDPCRGAESTQHEEMEEPHTAAAQNDRDPRTGPARVVRARRRGQRTLLEAAQDAGRGLQEQRIEIVEMVGKAPGGGGEGARPDDDSRREPTGRQEVLAEGRALRLGSSTAVGTVAAGCVVGHGYPLADGEVGDAGPDRGHLADDFVPEHRTGADGGSSQFEQVGAAQAAPAQAQQQLARTGYGVGLGPPGRQPGRVDRNGVHSGVSFHQMERRIHRRFPRRIELRFWRPGEVQAHTAYTSNISKSGLFLNSAIGLEPGERLRLEIVDREGGFFAEGRVARVHRVALALRQVENQGVGVRFLPPEELIETLVPLARQAGPSPEAARFAPPSAPVARATSAPTQAAPAPALRGAGDAPRPVSAPELAPETVLPVRFSEPASFLSTFHRDICAGGLFVSTPDLLPLQAMVWIDLELPIPGELPRRFAGRVVQRFEAKTDRDGGSSHSGMAVHFLEPDKVVAELRPLLAILRR